MTAEAKKIKPQGFTRVDNELLEALCRAQLGARELRVTLAVVRLTLGYNRQEAKISLGRLYRLTAIPKEDLCKILKRLAQKGILLRRKEAGRLVLGLAKEGLVNQPVGENANPQDTSPEVGKSTNPQVGKSTNPSFSETLARQEVQRSLNTNTKETTKKTSSPEAIQQWELTFGEKFPLEVEEKSIRCADYMLFLAESGRLKVQNASAYVRKIYSSCPCLPRFPDFSERRARAKSATERLERIDQFERAKIYARMVRDNYTSFDGVPAELKNLVQKILENWGNGCRTSS